MGTVSSLPFLLILQTSLKLFLNVRCHCHSQPTKTICRIQPYFFGTHYVKYVQQIKLLFASCDIRPCHTKLNTTTCSQKLTNSYYKNDSYQQTQLKMKRKLDIEFNVLYKAHDVLYLLIYFPIKLTKSQFLFKISLYYC